MLEKLEPENVYIFLRVITAGILLFPIVTKVLFWGKFFLIHKVFLSS